MRIFNRNQRDLEFVDQSRSVYQSLPVQLAKDVRPNCFEQQKQDHGSFKLPHCPGIIDYAQMGYIIPAWVDMHIIANAAGVSGFIGSADRGTHGFQAPRRMANDIVDGVFQPDGVPLATLNFSSPWKIFASKNITALVMPATFHSSFLNDLYVWPGVVDYKKFHVVNFMASAKRPCEIHIKAGDPLLQVIPFMNKELVAGYGPGTDEQRDATLNEITGDDTQFYRKFLRLPKIFKLSDTTK